MNAAIESSANPLGRMPPVGDAVWTRLWRNAPPLEKDDAILSRERRGPRWQWAKQELHAHFGNLIGLKSIELGSGRGDLSVMLAEQGAVVTLLDVNTTALQSAAERFTRLGLRGALVQSDLREVRGIQGGPFDVAVSIGVIEHFSGSARTDVLRAHYDALRPGGMAIVSVPHAWCLPYRIWKAYLELRGWWPYGLEIPYSKSELARRAREAGFAQIDLRSMGLRHSVGEHWIKRFTGKRPEWMDTPSALDPLMGLSLVMIARKGMAV